LLTSKSVRQIKVIVEREELRPSQASGKVERLGRNVHFASNLPSRKRDTFAVDSAMRAGRCLQ